MREDANMSKKIIDVAMMEQMCLPEVKATGFTVHLELKDGSKRVGIYLDLVSDPLNRYGFKDTQFIKFKTNRPEKDTIAFLPVTQVATIEWAL